MTNEIKVGVIIPCYNCAAHIEETLQSLVNQTTKDFEVVCVDDGSTDSTLEILRRFESSNALNLRIVTQPNGGVSVARNRGIREAKGKYLLFLDSDDLYRSDFIKTLVDAKEKRNVDVSYCRLSRNLDDVKFVAEGLGAFEARVQEQTQEEAMNKLLFEMGRYGFVCYLYEKEKLERLELLFDENTKFGEDREFNWKYLANCVSCAWVDAPLYGYRVNVNSVTKKKASWRKTDLLQAVKRIETYLETHNVPFCETFKSYMFARATWAAAKTFAVSRDRALFCRLLEEYDVKTQMKRTIKDKNKLVAFASVLFLVHPMLFYYVVGLK